MHVVRRLEETQHALRHSDVDGGRYMITMTDLQKPQGQLDQTGMSAGSMHLIQGSPILATSSTARVCHCHVDGAIVCLAYS